MKKTNLYGAMAFGLLLTACSDKVDEPTGSQISTEDHTLYVNLSIHGDNSATRTSLDNGNPAASDFATGEGESDFNNAYFVFYDEDGLVVGDLVPVTLSGATTVGADGSVESYYKSVVPVSVRKGEKDPVGVICYINPISPSSLQNHLDVMQTVSRERVYSVINNKKYFAMSNSVYYPNTGQYPADDAVPQITVEIKEGQLFPSEAEAMAAGDGLTVDIYVERYASKLTFKVEEGDDKNVPYKTATRVFGDSENAETSDVDVVLTFEPEYWALNAACNNGYVVKSFRRESSAGQILSDNYKYGLLNSRINIKNPMEIIDYGSTTASEMMSADNRWLWNNAGFHRSYWSMSPAYFQVDYPAVADDLKKIENPNQDYLSYEMLGQQNESANTTYGYAVGSDDFSAPHYFKETTVGLNAINSNNPAAAVASVIYVGKYKLTIDDIPVADNTNFFTYIKGGIDLDNDGVVDEQRPFIYFENDDLGNSKVPGGESMLKRFCAQSTILFTQDANGYHELNLDNYDKFVSAVHVSDISDKVKALVDGDEDTYLKLPANARSLQFISATAAEGVYIASGNGYKAIVADDAENVNSNQIRISEANSILMQQVGYAYFYKAGMAYFNIPVKHLGWYRPGNENRTNGVDNPIINWNLVRVGDFGMVRNHEYNVLVNKITGLASGIADESTPIVPPASTNDYYISYRVNILNWAVVPTQHVNL